MLQYPNEKMLSIWIYSNCMQKYKNEPPGRANKTERFPLKSSDVVTSFHVKGLGPPSFSSRTLALNTTFGIVSPSFKAMARVILLVVNFATWRKAMVDDNNVKTAAERIILQCWMINPKEIKLVNWEKTTPLYGENCNRKRQNFWQTKYRLMCIIYVYYVAYYRLNCACNKYRLHSIF